MFTNYKYVVTPDNEVIAISTYAGQTVKGVAKCHPNDQFDLEFGKRLAAARCEVKVCRKRLKRALQLEEEAYKAQERAEERLLKMGCYVDDANMALSTAEMYLDGILHLEPVATPAAAPKPELNWIPDPDPETSWWLKFWKWFANN